MENTIAALVAKNKVAWKEKRRGADMLTACLAEIHEAMTDLSRRMSKLSTQKDSLSPDHATVPEAIAAYDDLMVALSECHFRLSGRLDRVLAQMKRVEDRLAKDQEYVQIEFNVRVLEDLLPIVQRLGAGKFVAYVTGHTDDWAETIDFINGLRQWTPLGERPASLARDLGAEAAAVVHELSVIPCKLVYNYTSTWRALDVPPEFKLASLVVTAGDVSQNATVNGPAVLDSIISDHISEYAEGAKEKRNTVNEYFREFQVIVDARAYKGGPHKGGTHKGGAPL